MQEGIIDKDSAAHYTWGSGCESWILTESSDLSVKQESMPEGTREELHFHKHSTQFFFVLKGIATFYLDGQKKTLSNHQGILVLPQVKHFIANETNSPIEFLVISEPSTLGDRVNITGTSL